MSEQSLQKLNSSRKEELWASRIMRCRESGLGVQKWCSQQGLSYHTYYKWQSKLYRMYSESGNNFYEIPSEGSQCSHVATVRIGVYTADIYSGADEGTLTALIRALKSC